MSLRWKLRLTALRVAAGAVIVAGALVGVVAFMVWDSSETSRKAMANQQNEREAFNDRIDVLQDQNARLIDDIAALRTQLLGLGVAPVVEAPASPRRPPRARSTTSTTRRSTPTTDRTGPPTTEPPHDPPDPPPPPTCTTVPVLGVCDPTG